MTEAPKKKRWPRRLLAAFLLLLLLPVILFALLQTPPGKGALASILSSVASSAMEQEVRIEGMHGFIPLSIQIGEFGIADADGRWLAISDFRLNWSLKEALAGRLHVLNCSADTIEIERIPPGKEKPKTAEWAIPEIPSFVKRVFVDELDVQRLALGEALVGAPAEFSIQGSLTPGQQAQAQRLQLHASRTDGATGSLDLEAGLTGTPPRMTISLSAIDEPIVSHFLKLEPAVKGELQFQGDGLVKDWSGHLSARIGGKPVVEMELASSAAQGVKLSTSGRFHLAQPWLPDSLTQQVGQTCDFEIAAELPNKEMLSVTQFTLAAEQCTASLAGTLDFTAQRADAKVSLEYRDFSALMEIPGDAPRGPLHANASAKGPLDALAGTLVVELADTRLLESEWQLSRTGDLHAQAEIRAWTQTALLPPELDALEEVEATVDIWYTASGEVKLDKTVVKCQAARVDITGALNPEKRTLDLQYALECRDLTMLNAILGIDAAGALAVQGHATGDDQRLAVTLEAHSNDAHVTPDARWANAELHLEAESLGWPDQPFEQTQVQLSGRVLDAVFGRVQEPEISITAFVDAPTQDDIKLTEFTVTDKNANVSATGRFNADAQSGELDIAATINDLAPTLSPLGSEASGGVSLLAKVVASEGFAPTSLSLNGKATDLKGLPGPALAALGREATLEAEAVIDKTTANLTRLVAKGAGAEMNATASYGFEQRGIEAEATVAAADLSVFGPSLDKRLAGNIQAAVTATGTLDNLTLDCTLEGESVNVDDVGVEALQVKASLEGLPNKPQGPFEFRLTSQGETMRANGLFAFAQPELQVNDLRIEAGENTLDGALKFGTESGDLNAHMEADFGDLAVFGRVLQQSLNGALRAEATVSGQNGVYALAANAEANNVESPFASVESASISAELAGSPLAPEGTTAVTLTALRAPQATVENLRLKAEADGSQININLSADGAIQESTPFDLALSGSVGDEGLRMTLDELTGDIASYPLTLEKPLVVAHNEGDWNVEPFALTFDTCTMDVSGSYAEDGVALSYAFRDLSLGIAETFGGPAMCGTASGSMEVSGTPGSPVLDTTVQCADLHMGEGSGDVPAFDVEANTRIAGDALQLTARTTIENEADVQAEATMPVQFSLAPWAFAIQDNAPLAGKLESNVNLEVLPRALGAIDHLLQGRLEGRFDLEGAVGSPVLVGDLTVTDGRYENAVMGTIFDEIDVLFRAERDALRIVRCTATDGGKGGLEVTGQLALNPESHFPFEAKLALQKAQLARRDSLSGQVDGTLSLSGSSKEASVKGDLVLGPANVYIPERLPPSIAEVEVVEVNSSSESPQEDEDADKPPPYPVNLDIKCKIPGRVYVRATPLDSEWKGDLEVKGTARSPEIKGLLTIERGTLMFLSRQFALNDSTISMDGQTPPDPYLRIKAESRIKDMLARLNITGTASELEFKLSSDPSLPQDEILARLLFGRDLAQATPLQALQIARTARMLSGKSNGLGSMSGQPKLPGVDRVQLKQADGSNDVAVEVGKYLTEDIYLDLLQGMGASGSKASVGMEVTPQISVEGHVGSDAQSGLGVFWKKNY